MRHDKIIGFIAIFLAVSMQFYFLPIRALAHCDSLDGPVIQAAKLALEKGDPTPVLKWVKKEHEDEIRKAFNETITVRAKGNEARQLADRYFFETLVRIHRAGESEAYTGLKPAGSVDPGITAADKALGNGSVNELGKSISTAVTEGIRKRFAAALEKKKHAEDSIEAGREFVEAYVDYVHFVERVYYLASHGAPHTHRDSPHAVGHPH